VHAEDVKALLAELNRSDIECSPFASIDRTATFKGVVIQVGPKPSKEEAALIDLENKVFDPRLKHLSEHDELFNKYWEIRRKLTGTNISHANGSMIPGQMYPPQ
jgi:hypothetical protein